MVFLSRFFLYTKNTQQKYAQWMDGEPSKMNFKRKELLDKLGMDWTIQPRKKNDHLKGKTKSPY
jgi:hypothetical protein